jgi:hypothetical protein
MIAVKRSETTATLLIRRSRVRVQDGSSKSFDALWMLISNQNLVMDDFFLAAETNSS